MDTIYLRSIRLEAMIGIYRRERTTSQPIEINLEMALPHSRVFETGKVADTIDYAVVMAKLRALLEGQRFGLVESLAEAIARLLIDEFHSPRVKVSVAKLGILKDVGQVGVAIERSAAAPAAASRGHGFASGSDPFDPANNAP